MPTRSRSVGAGGACASWRWRCPHDAGRFAPSPSGVAAPRQPSHRAARVVLRPLARRRPSCCGSRTSIRSVRGREHEAARARRPRRARHRLGRRAVRQSERRARHREAFEALRARGRALSAAGARARRSARRRGRRTAPAPTPTPGPAAPWRRRARRASAAGAACVAARRGRRARSAFDDAARRDALRRSSTTSSCGAGTPADPASRPPTTSPSSSTTRDQGVGEVVRGDDLLETTPRQVLLARAAGLAVPRYAHVPLVLGPDGRRLAKRDGAVTLAERLARGERVEDVVGWMAASAGLAPSARR